MKLKRVTKNDPMERLAVGIHKSTMEMLAAYQAFYKQTYGDDIAMGALVEEMLRGWTADDKGFAAFVKDQQKTGVKPDTRESGGHEFTHGGEND